MRTRNLIIATAVASAIAAIIGGCAAAVSTIPPPATTAPPATTSPPGTSPASSPASSAPMARIGTAFTVTTDSGARYTVTLAQVLAPAQPDSQFDAAPAGKRLVGIRLVITGVSGTATDDANSDVSLIGSDHQVYQPAFDTLAAGTNFSSGDFTVSPGMTEIGWVSFEVPDAVTAASVQWSPGFLSSTSGTWTVG